MHNILDPTRLIQDFSYLGLFVTLFLESGIFFGFFLPGDSLLFTAGLLAAQHTLNLPSIMLVAVAGAILGNSAGYFTGNKVGPTLIARPKSRWFSAKHMQEAHEFFEKKGPQSLILARFIPAVRTFVPIAAGVATMPYRTFLTFNAIGGLLWGITLPLLGFLLGKTVKNVDHYLLPIILLIAAVSLLPVLRGYLKSRKAKVN